MREYTGVLRTLGASTYQNSLNVGTNTITTYAYLEIGDQIIKKVKAYTGIDGELKSALGEPVTLHMQGRYLVGVTTGEGRTFASGGDNMLINVFLVLALIFAAFFLSFILIGLPMWFVVWQYVSRVAAQIAARSLPNAILI